MVKKTNCHHGAYILGGNQMGENKKISSGEKRFSAQARPHSKKLTSDTKS